jgi:hypothetical protein
MGNGCTVQAGVACLANARLNSGNGGCTIRRSFIVGMVCCRNDYLVNTACAVAPPRLNLSVGPITPVRGQLLANVTIPLNYEINMDISIAPGTAFNQGWGSLVHFTATGNDGGSHSAVLGDRIPAIWFRPRSFSLYV